VDHADSEYGVDRTAADFIGNKQKTRNFISQKIDRRLLMYEGTMFISTDLQFTTRG